MTDITSNESVTLSSLLTDITLVKNNPSAIQRTILTHLSNVTGGIVDIVDPTNPFVFLLESSCVNTAAAIQENRINLRKQYSSLAQTDDEIYMHMSDKDYVGRFATPSKTSFKFLLQYSHLLGKMVKDSTEGCIKATIPRDTVLAVGDYTFTLQYPIVIRYYDNGVLQITYDTTYEAPLQTLTTNVIEYTIKQDSSGIKWLRFEVPVYQFAISTTYYTVQSSSYFVQEIDYTNQFYYIRVLYKDTNGDWQDMVTTHTDQVYDASTPTAIIKVYEDTLNVYIPNVYINSSLINSEVRVDVYTTLGALTADLTNYKVDAFSTTLRAINETRDTDSYTAVMNNVIYLAYSDTVVTGGSDGLSFSGIKAKVVANSNGNFNLPITNAQLDSKVTTSGFTLVKNVDVVTNRIFLATRNLPTPTDTELITSANLSMETFTTTLATIEATDGVYVNTNRYTIPSSTLYLYDNGKVSIYPKSQVTALKSDLASNIALKVNSNKFLYSPLHYVLDNTSTEFKMRPYYLDQPSVSGLNFVSQNITANLTVNTNSYAISKSDTGYRIITTVSSDDYYKALDDRYIQAQLAYIPEGDTNYAYVNGTILGTASSTSERVFAFDIVTNFDIDSDDYLYLTNFKMVSTGDITIPVALEKTFTILYTTTSRPTDFVADDAQSMIGSFLLDNDAIVITKETLDVKFGSSLSSLWSNTRSVIEAGAYKTYESDVPMTYTENVYEKDSATGSIVNIGENGEISYNLIHSKGDTVYDTAGNIVYKYLKGDAVVDSNGDPILISENYVTRYLDMLFVDGAYYFATDSNYVDYGYELASVIESWVVDSMGDFNDILLEQSKIFYYPKKAYGSVSVMINNDTTMSIDASQSLSVTLYVTESVYKDTRIKEQLKTNTITTINSIIQSTTVSKSAIIDALLTLYGSTVVAVDVSGLGGSADYSTVTLTDDSHRLSIGKQLVVQGDDTTIVSEDIEITFVSYLKN